MSKRLQVVVDDVELRRFERAARRAGLTLSEWVRQVLRGAERSLPDGDATTKIAAIRAADQHRFPTGDMDQMLEEIERGRDLPA